MTVRAGWPPFREWQATHLPPTYQRIAAAYRALGDQAGCSASRAFQAVHRLTDAGLLRMDAGAGSLVATVNLVADSRRLP